ncbi:MAG: 3-phosphoserine/phosphohydroxythreonine transaminase [Clostridiales Family XIII bacterium]|jgi:phosphoserine aminotransferase|nr:3-phosphoserine/phosphohydroxythreonine transaminase [Clostridiales Family XIII bacterium]
MSRIYNFSAGPSILPESVLEKAAAEIMDYEGSGMSVMEMSHRSKVYDGIIKETEAKLRSLLSVPDNYKVLFLQGGATTQFAMTPMNLLGQKDKADYVLTGSFSTKAYKEALLFGKEINIAASTKDEHFCRIPKQHELKVTPGAAYVHICENNTIFGTKWKYVPDTGAVPLVSDMSSCILSEPVDVSKYGLIYAGAQKNVAPAGLTIVIIREDLLGDPIPGTPSMLNYKLMADNESMYNTPPCWSIYVAKLVLEWIESLGGLAAMKEQNEKKAALLYDYIDSTDFYKSAVVAEDRSTMNVVFTTGDEELDAKFVKASAADGMSNLKGHRSVGGMRASIYNAMPEAGVAHLVAFMKKFESEQ